MSSKKRQGGFYLVFLAILLFAILILVAAVLGLGLLSRSKTVILNLANLSALAALQGFVDSTSPTYAVKVSAGITRAESILAANKIPGSNSPIQNLGNGVYGPGGRVDYGIWYQTDPGSDPCGSAGLTYPCFVRNSVPGVVNSVQVQIKTDASNPVIFDFGNLLGINSFNLAQTATAAIVPRCTAYIMDLSNSVQFQTHTRWINPDPVRHSQILAGGTCGSSACHNGAPPGPYCHPNCTPKWIIDEPPFGNSPAHAGLSAILDSNVAGTDCIDGNYLSYYATEDQTFWCNYDPTRSALMSAPLEGVRHYQDDYVLEQSPVGAGGALVGVWVDKYSEGVTYQGPQPFTNNLLAFNAGLRRMQATQSGTDQGLIMMFDANIRDQYPPTGLTNDLGFLVQLTNVDNGGKLILSGGANIPDPAKPIIHPNYIDRGWLPLATSGATNIIQAVYQAALVLRNQCPAISSKSIIVASDFVSTCSLTSNGTVSTCGGNYAAFQAAEQQMFTTNIATTPTIVPNLSTMLTQWEISLSVLLDGVGVRPNYFNIKNPNKNCGTWTAGSGYSISTNDPGCYLTYEEARALGYGGINSSTPFVAFGSFDPAGSAISDSAGFSAVNNGQPGYIFGRAVGDAMQLAYDTGGIFAPLFPPLSSSPGATDYNTYYTDFFGERGGALCDSDLDTDPLNDCNRALYKCTPCVLKDQYRRPCDPAASIPCDGTQGANNTTLTYAPLLLSKAEQAATIARQAVGFNPYTLVSNP